MSIRGMGPLGSVNGHNDSIMDRGPASAERVASTRPVLEVSLGAASAQNAAPKAEPAAMEKTTSTGVNIDPEPGFWQRVFKTASGGVKQSASQYSDAARAQYEASQGGRTQRTMDELRDIEWAVAKAKYAYDTAQDVGAKQSSQNELNANLAKLKAYAEVLGDGAYDVVLREAYDTADKLGSGDAKSLYAGLAGFDPDAFNGVQKQATAATAQMADQLQQSAGADIAQAKQGLGAVGQVLVDAGVAGTQMLGDAAANLVAPGMGKVALAQRVFGSGTQEARQHGANLSQQMGYGAANAALELLTEFMFDGLAGIYGGGAADDVVEAFIQKATGSPAGRAALRVLAGAAGEGAEELVSGIVNPLLQTIYNSDALRESYGNGNLKETVSGLLHDALIGTILGTVGGGANAVKSYGADAKTPAAPDGAALGAEATANGENATTATPAEEKAAEAIVEGEKAPAAEPPADPLLAAIINTQQQKTAASEETTVVSTDPKMHTDAEQARVNLYVSSTNKSLASWVSRVQSALAKGDYTATKMRKVLNAVKENAAVAIKDACGVDVSGFSHMIDGSAIKHIADRHGADGAADSTMPTVDDIARVEYVLENFDGCERLLSQNGKPVESSQFRDKNNRPAPVVQFYKKVDGHYYVIEAVPDSADKKIHIISAYMKNGESVNQVLNMPSSDAPQPTPEVPLGTVASAYFDSTLTHEAKDVKKAPDAESSVGAAAAGFETPDHLGTERVSKIHSGVARYTQAERDATARSRADYDELFRYTSQTEVQSEQQADNLLYVEVGGVRTFLRDYDTAAYEDLVRYLSDAPAWNGVMTDAAMKIKHELQGLSIDGEISEDEYTAWLTTMREHATETGRGTQAWAKWTRGDNRSGEATELEAWETLQQSDLSEEERRQLFDAIVRFDRRIEAAGSDADLRSVILEIAEQRGTLSALTGKQSKLLRKIAENSLSSMTTEQLKQFAYASSAALAQDKSGTDSGAKIKALQMLNMMSNTKTAVTNLAGNTSFYLLDALSMDGASLLDMALSKLTGTRSVSFESSLLSRDARKSVTDAIKLSLAEATMDVNMGSGNRYQSGRSRSFKSGGVGVLNTNTAADKFAERILSACERNMNYLMTTSDEAFKGAARSTARGTQRLVDAGKIKTKSATYATEQAEDLAAYRTFQKDGKVAAVLQGIHDLLNLVGVGDSGKRMGKKGHVVHSFGAGDLVAPFTRVAANLASVGLDYSPVNAVKGTVEILDTLRLAALKRTVDPSKQAKAVSDFARGMSGTAIAFGVSLLAQAGLIRRAEDEDDEDVAALNQSEGMTGTQVNIDAANRWIGGGDAAWQYGDTLIDMSRLEPLNFILSLGVEMADNEVDGFLSTFADPASYGDTVKSTLETAGDLPVLSTVGDFTEDVQVYGADPALAAAEALGKTAISSVTPNIVAALAKGLDDKQRNVYGSDEEGLAGVGDVLLKTLLSRIPGARESLPTTVNSLGEEKDNPGTLAQRLVAAMINPLGVNQYTQSEVSQEMERVRKATGETAFYPTNRKPPDLSYTDKNGVRHEVELTYEQRQKFQVARSGAQMAVSADMMGNGHYRSASAKEQAALLDRVRNYAHQYAKASVLGKDSVDSWVLNSQTAQKDLGISQTDFFYYYEKYGSDVLGGGATYEKTKRMVAAGLSIDQWAKMQKTVDTSGNGSTSKAELMSYIEANLPRSQWSRVFDAYKGSQKWNNPYG